MKELFRKNKWVLLVSSLVILLPVVFGLIVWDYLPDTVPLHWGMDGKADGFGSPWVVVLIVPAILLALHWLCILVTWKDNANNEQSRKVLTLTYWILPFISVIMSIFVYAAAFGHTVHMLSAVWIILGATFILIGNYLPKCRHNRTIGIKIKWTLANEENWNKTHRIAGIVSVAVGVLCFPAAFLPEKAFLIAMVVLIAACVGVPTVYSYLYYKKQLREGTATKADFAMPKTDKRIGWVVTVITVLIFAFCAWISFTGEIDVALGDTSFTVEASFYSDLTVAYADVESVEYREAGVDGTRVMGFGSARLLMGAFENGEFGTYTRYTYTKPAACAVLTVRGEILVIGCADAAETKAFCDALSVRITEKGGNP